MGLQVIDEGIWTVTYSKKRAPPKHVHVLICRIFKYVMCKTEFF